MKRVWAAVAAGLSIGLMSVPAQGQAGVDKPGVGAALGAVPAKSVVPKAVAPKVVAPKVVAPKAVAPKAPHLERASAKAAVSRAAPLNASSAKIAPATAKAAPVKGTPVKAAPFSATPVKPTSAPKTSNAGKPASATGRMDPAKGVPADKGRSPVRSRVRLAEVPPVIRPAALRDAGGFVRTALVARPQASRSVLSPEVERAGRDVAADLEADRSADLGPATAVRSPGAEPGQGPDQEPERGIPNGLMQDHAQDHPPGMSIGEAIGLRRTHDPLGLKSSVALVIDASSGEVLFEKNTNVVLPIASITKLMTAMVVLDARQPLDEKLLVEEIDKDTERFSRSHLPVGTTLTRGELLQLALMSSENRAASVLARNFPGGITAFVRAANRKAQSIGMNDSVFADGTGLSASNVSTARDLAMMARYAATYPQIRDYSTAEELSVRLTRGPRMFHTTNRLTQNDSWELDLQKTGYITEAGNCLVMKGRVDGKAFIVVLLDSSGRYSRISDAQRIRRWLQG